MLEMMSVQCVIEDVALKNPEDGDIKVPNLQDVLRTSSAMNYEISTYMALPNLQNVIKKEMEIERHICPIRFRSFQDERDLDMHSAFNYRNVMNTNFDEVLNEHNGFAMSPITHSNSGDYGCSVCNKTFEDEMEFIHHCELHEEEGNEGEGMKDQQGGAVPYSVTKDPTSDKDAVERDAMGALCDNTFSRKTRLENHRQSIHGDPLDSHGGVDIVKGPQGYICTICLQKFTNPDKFLYHVREHEREEGQCCPVCFKTFSDQNDLNQHCFEHLERGQQLSEYPCDVCQMIFRSPRALRVHVRKHIAENLDTKRPKVLPELPSKEPATEVSVVIKGRYGPTDQRPYVCPICQANFARKFFLIEHCRIHTGERPHKCPVCGKGFRQRFHLKRHQGVHTYHKPYRCSFPECKKAFTRNATLVEHTRVHNGERPFSCPQCEKSFVRRADVARHILTHSQKKPYHCGICSKGFSQKSYLVSHALVHTGKSRHNCEICDKGFVRKSHLTYHLKTHETKSKNGNKRPRKDVPGNVATYTGDFMVEHGSDVEQDEVSD